MDRLRSILVLFSADATSCCNELPPEQLPDQRLQVVDPAKCASAGQACATPASAPSSSSATRMPLDLFTRIAKRAQERSWRWTVVTNSEGLPQPYLRVCQDAGAEIILPAGYAGPPPGLTTSIVFDTGAPTAARAYPYASAAILRVRREDIEGLSAEVIGLAGDFSDVSLRHPELLSYTEKDFAVYREQLRHIGQWLLDQGAAWSKRSIECLMGGLGVSESEECGAGDTMLTVGPDGGWHICPATMHHGLPACGHVLDDIELANRHLFGRSYSLPCGSCDTTHCSRCVYQNKRGTFEFCVPARNVCLLAHYELEAQAEFARMAVERNVWRDGVAVPETPSVYDPLELVKAESEAGGEPWFELRGFSGRPEDLTPNMMLNIIHDIYGHVHALLECARFGCRPSTERLSRDGMGLARRHATRRYRDAKLANGCPTVSEVMTRLCELAEHGDRG